MSYSENGISRASFGQIIDGTSYLITAFSDGSVTSGSDQESESSGDGLEEYSEFSFASDGETQLKMEIDGVEKCLSFTSDPSSVPSMVDCSNINTYFLVVDGCD